MPNHLKLFVFIATQTLAILLALKLSSNHYSKQVIKLESKLEQEQNKYKNLVDEYQAAIKVAEDYEAIIQHKNNQLTQNQHQSNEKANRVYALQPDSLPGYIANQLNYLDTAWY